MQTEMLHTQDFKIRTLVYDEIILSTCGVHVKTLNLNCMHNLNTTLSLVA